MYIGLAKGTACAHSVRMAIRDDVIFRVIHQLVEALLRAAGLRKKQDLPAAEAAVGEGLRSLGLSVELLKKVDAATLRRLVPEPTRRGLLGAALVELACCARDAGDLSGADLLDEAASDLVIDIHQADVPTEVWEALPANLRGVR